MNAASHGSYADNASHSEIAVDDLAFISQFADVVDETPLPSPSIPGVSARNDTRPIVPLPRKAITSAIMRPRKHSAASDVDSEDEIEEFLIGATPKKVAAAAVRIKKEDASSDTEIADAESSSSSDSSSDSDLESSHSTESKSTKKQRVKTKISDRRHAKLSAELDAFTGASSSKHTRSDDDIKTDEDERNPSTVFIPAPMSDSGDSEDEGDEDDEVKTSLKNKANRPKKNSSNATDAGFDEDADQPVTSSSFASKHELADPPVPVVEIADIGPEERMEPVGNVMSIVGNAVIVQASDHGSHRVLDTGSLLVFEDRKVLGAIFEAFGPVMKPMYIIRLPSSSDTTHIAVGAKVFYVPGRSTFLFTNALRQMKGSDASNVYDEEVDDREMEFSDDEEERTHKKMLETMRKERAHTNGNQAGSANNTDSFYPKQSQSSTSALPSDDVTDIFYGDAYDESNIAGPSSPTSRTNALSSTMNLDPRAGRSIPSAYDEISPYDEPPPPPDPVSRPPQSPSFSKSDALPTITSRGPPQGASGSSSLNVRHSERGGRGGGTRGRGGRGGAAPSGAAAGGNRGRGRGRGRGQRASYGNESVGRSAPAGNEAGSSAYDPRHPGFTDAPSSSNNTRSHEQRELSPASAAIARVTGDWTTGAGVGAESSFDPYQAQQQQQQQQGLHGFYGGGGGGQYNPNFNYNLGYDANMLQFVAPHINPRFAAAAGMGMGMGAMNLQQQQMLMQMQQYMAMGMDPMYAGGHWDGSTMGGGSADDQMNPANHANGDASMGGDDELG